ncbi:ankyrin repeat-containing domain protein, partial [Fusarium tricinctum]
MHASSRGHTAVVCELLRLGADTSLVSCAGYSAAEDAAASGDIRSLKTLLAGSGSSVTGKCLLLSSANGHVEIVEFLLQHKTLDPSSTDEKSWTPLHRACRNGHVEVVKVLLSRGANIDTRDNIGRTPLNRAVRIGSFGIAQRLLEAGASPVSCDSSEMSLTHFVAAGGFNEVLDLLLAAGNIDDGVDLNELDWEFETPLIKAIRAGNPDIVARLLNAGADIAINCLDDTSYQYFLWTPRNGTNIETARFLIENGTRIHPDDHQQRNILHWVARMGTADILSILLECGVDVRADGRTALHLAIMEGAVECVRLLLRAGANPNAID